jgi:hypothetical protein
MKNVKKNLATYCYVRFELYTAVTAKSDIFWALVKTNLSSPSSWWKDLRR